VFFDEEMDIYWSLVDHDRVRMTDEQYADATVHQARDACVVDVNVIVPLSTCRN
jgi:hypothetical protein